MTALDTPQTPTDGTKPASTPAAPTTPVSASTPAPAGDKPQEKQTAPQTEKPLPGLSVDAPKVDEKAPRPGSPEKFDWKIEGDPAFVSTITGKFEPVARKLGLTNDEAHGVYGAFADVMRSNVEKMHKTWVDALQQDKEIGGDKLEESLGLANSIVQKYGSDEFRDLLKGGLRHNPALVKMLVKMAKDVGGDRLPRVSEQPPGRGKGSNWYPTMNKK